MSQFQVTQGTQTNLANDPVGTNVYPISKIDIGAAGASQLFTGTFFGGTLNQGTINTGTVNVINGTINVGTVTAQINPKPFQLGTSINVVGTAGAGLWGTIVAACGAGTKQYVSGVDIVCVSGTGVEVAITNIGVGGSTGAGVLARGFFGTTGGISKNFNPIQASGTNGTLAYWLGGAGTVDITLQYWQGV